ncbi:BNR/Asp-box repeat-containing protein [Cryptosporidium muris RN66]|uniref:BNR/Asp-box repeat-containing protein n=1 Tax=Cryptosporidium muris (strain RN66) TaxID=441375 RepID=B6AHR1_CRYMR|nr:BNR/Asp-box repeat-containing protein [Cryptosporidium muris RN66]EEA07756.1 BNR/Asp-box repeat-containing protein [Cryptosporidium muris RN66]|eukprot:XP_002142105.1 BNR/Asp-box repeat-containing protein [Cryptosporidium muris RN66]
MIFRNIGSISKNSWIWFYFLVLFFFNITIIWSDKKVSVSEVTLDSSIEILEWCGENHDIVLAKTIKGHVYRSANRGKNWRDITDNLARLSANLTSNKSSSFLVKSISINPVDKNIILIVGSKYNHFISINAGETFRRISHTGTIHTWLFHPSKSRYALFSSWTDGCQKSILSNLKKNSTTNSKCIHQLFVTKDLGLSFTRVIDYVVQFHWDTNKNSNTNRIFFTHHRKKQGDQLRYGGWMQNIDFSFTDDFGSHYLTPVKGGNKFLISNNYIFVAKLQNHIQQTVSLVVSTDDGATFKQVQLPHPLTEKSYTILDTSEDTVILHVNHGSDIMSNTGHIYISDKSGTRFALSLANNVRTKTGECEFDKVMSLDGVYLANIKEHVFDSKNEVDAVSKDMVFLYDLDIDDTVEDADTSSIEAKHKSGKQGKMEEVVKTVITFNKGGEWNYIQAPTTDSRGNPIDCNPDQGCYLHLHGISNFENYAPFYSVENAVGIILGTGNVGTHLLFESENINTYMSRDGGRTWMEVHKGAYIYELGDFGGLVVMANDLKQTNQVIFSWNEGLSWYDFDLGIRTLQVDNIMIEPNSSSMEFILYGTRGKSGVLYHLDFNSLGQVPCTGASSPDTMGSDYETWSPNDGKNFENCILGKQLVFTRKKQTAECYNGKDFRRPVEKNICQCTEEDFTCDFGFTRSIGSYECRPESIEIVQDDPKIGQCTSSGVFYTSAYRKLPGDVCVGGWEPPPVAVPCPDHAPSSIHAKLIFVLIICLLLFLLKQGIFGDWKQWSEVGFDTYMHVQYKVLGVAKRRSTSLQGLLSIISSFFTKDTAVIFSPSSPKINMNRNSNYSTVNNGFNNSVFMEDDEEDIFQIHDINTSSPQFLSSEKNHIKNKTNDVNLEPTQKHYDNINFRNDTILNDTDVFDDDIDPHSLFTSSRQMSSKLDTSFNHSGYIDKSNSFETDTSNIFQANVFMNDFIEGESFPKIQSPHEYNEKNQNSNNYIDDNLKDGIELL